MNFQILDDSEDQVGSSDRVDASLSDREKT